MDPRDALRLLLPEEVTPEVALECFRDSPGLVLLETAGPTPGRSLLAIEPRRMVRLGPPGVEVSGPWTDPAVPPRWDGPAGGGTDPFEVLADLVRSEHAVSTNRRPFLGGWIGYLGYEVADLLEDLPPPPSHGELPTLWFGAYDWAVVWDPGAPPRMEGAPLPGAGAEDVAGRMDHARRRLEEEVLLRGAPDRRELPPSHPAGSKRSPGELVRPGVHGRPGPPGRPDPPSSSGSPVSSSLGEKGYRAGVERIREYIRAGDLYQANLTHQVSAPWHFGGVDLYRRLMARSPAPYGAYLNTGSGEVASISPESFLRLRGDRVTTRPIKGTAPRGETPEEDRRRAEGLRRSVKDQAENVMIVDLMRNDLSRVCRPGTVSVPQLLGLETHPSVHHLVSTVEGRLAAGKSPLDLLRATLPGGSITGAPKIRAMEILRELEPVRRGVYTGALGILEFGGDLELSIAIRTATLVGSTASFGVGGGITLASDAAAEWRESMDKAAPFLEVVGRPGRGGGSRAHAQAPPAGGARGRRGRAVSEPRAEPETGKGRVLVLDNYDSFVHNVARYLREVGGPRLEVRVVRSDAVSVSEILGDPPSHLVISPGPCTPDQAGVSVELVRALGGTVPTLGICLGHQAVARAFGGRVVRARRPLHGRVSRIHHSGAGLLEGIPSPFEAGRYHSLVVDPGSLPDVLEVQARDEEGVIMAIRHRHRPVWGVQFHPESILTAPGRRILGAFLKMRGGQPGPDAEDRSRLRAPIGSETVPP